MAAKSKIRKSPNRTATRVRPPIVTEELPIVDVGQELVVDGQSAAPPVELDPRQVLARLRESRKSVQRARQQVESAMRVQDRWIARARSLGFSDATIAAQLGVSRQAVMQRPR